MQRRLIIAGIAVFSLGVLSALAFVSLGSDEKQIDASVKQLKREESKDSSEMSRLKGLSQLKRFEILSSAIDEGTLDSLKLLRPDFLESLPDYRTALLPALKIQLLENLLARFRRSDWSDWPRAAFGDGDGPSPARIFVDDVLTQNKELGTFAGTAAVLFHRLYLCIEEGVGFDLTLEVASLNGKEKEGIKSPGLLPRGEIVETIAADLSFLEVLERARADLIVKRVGRYPNELKTNLRLFVAMDPAHANERVLGTLAMLIGKLSLKTSPKYREEFALNGLKSHLDPFVRLDEGVRRNLADFYSICSTDALMWGKRARAEELLKTSVSIMPGLKSQKLVQEAIDALTRTGLSKEVEQVQELDVQSLATPEPKKTIAEGQGLFEDFSKRENEVTERAKGGFSFVFIIMFLVVLAIVALVCLRLYFRARSAHLEGVMVGRKKPEKARLNPEFDEPVQPVEPVFSHDDLGIADIDDLHEHDWLDPSKRRMGNKPD